MLAGVRPLHLGAQSGSMRVVQLLLDAPGIVVDTRADEARWAGADVEVLACLEHRTSLNIRQAIFSSAAHVIWSTAP